ncbi:MAG TPA: outer membrane beta-barrel protein [Gammaproteobacteria bacterium]|nr:outer membrane beta-barrel protein [Gammaproteobacteria bacterium]
MSATLLPPRAHAVPRAAACALCLALPSSFACAPAAADDQAPRRFELTPYAGYTIGGEFEQQNGGGHYELDEGNSAGLIFNIEARDVNTQWEVLYGRQSTKVATQAVFDPAGRLPLDVEYFQFGGTYLFDGDDTRPFVAMTVGVTHFGPTLPGVDSESFLSGSFGGGVQLRKTKRIGVRLEARVLATFVNTDGALFCHSGPQGGACAIQIHGTALYQLQSSAGVVFRF